VTYDLTSMSDHGDTILSAMTEEAYADMLADWERRIAQAVRGEAFE
jgi:hypothetical protein